MLLKKYCTESYTISEFMQLDNNDLNLIDKFLGNLKKNKNKYARLVFLLAVFLNNNNNIYAESLEAGLGTAASEIIHMVLIFGKYGCLGMGIKSMIEEMLQGANIKEATGAGLQYFIFYIVLQLYPELFSMIKF
ncbi:hypothetical protein [Terrisporobacter sp.]|uniref:hypothetical protein n=2 Tax=Terrisporobacter TaxID=1505652 RepID=UPI0028A2AB1D|nr:hypothetical protein [Terrisporobacter sp.]